MPALANLPSFDNTGNSLLNGTYYFREVVYPVGDSAGDLSGEYAAFGTITFNGAGSYTITNATENSLDSSGSGQQPFSTTGTATFAASGYGYFTDPLSSSLVDYGLISNSTLIASATEAGYNTLFIATLLSSPSPTVSSFQGNYQFAGFIPPSNGATQYAADVSFQLNPRRKREPRNREHQRLFCRQRLLDFLPVEFTEVLVQQRRGNSAIPLQQLRQFLLTVSPTFIYRPTATLSLAAAQNGFDIFVGTKNTGGTPTFSGLYYEAGLDWDATQLAASGFSSMDTYYGSYNAVNGNVIGHERIFYGLYQSVDGFTYNDSYPTSISGNTYTVTSAPYGTQYWFGNNGAIRIGFGIGPSLGISVGLQAPSLTGSGVYLSSQGMVNAASYAPFTAGVSPGEIVVLYGSNLAPSFQAASTVPLPDTLNGVTVTVNGVSAPIYYVSPGQLSVVIPYSAYYTVSSGFPIARIVVSNASGTSNAVTEFMNLTTPGVFTQNATGLGLASIYHATSTGFTAVTNSNPAAPGETVVAYVSGLGATVPSVTEGQATPASPLYNTVNDFDVLVNGTEVCGSESNATPCPFVGLAPYLANVYQVNIPIPSTATAGANTLEFIGPDSDNFQVSVPVGSGVASASDRAPSVGLSRAAHAKGIKSSPKPRTLPCLVTDKTCSSAPATIE